MSEYKLEIIPVASGGKIRLDISTWDDMEIITEDMGRWCKDTGCGVRTAYNEFKFKDDEQLTMFVMRWGGGRG